MPEGDGGRNKKIINPDQRGECKLSDGEQFKFLFHPGNIKSMEKPKNSQGVTLCMRYHTMGYCFKDCKYLNGHGTLKEGEAVEMARFLSTARQGRKQFLSNRGGADGRRQQQFDGKNKNDDTKG